MLFIFSTPVLIRHLWHLRQLFSCIGVNTCCSIVPILVKESTRVAKARKATATIDSMTAAYWLYFCREKL